MSAPVQAFRRVGHGFEGPPLGVLGIKLTRTPSLLKICVRPWSGVCFQPFDERSGEHDIGSVEVYATEVSRFSEEIGGCIWVTSISAACRDSQRGTGSHRMAFKSKAGFTLHIPGKNSQTLSSGFH